MKIKLIAILIFYILCAVSCNNQDYNVDIIEQTQTISFVADIEGANPQTKVFTGADFKSAWENGDEIGVYIVEEGRTLEANNTDNWASNIKVTYSDDGITQKWTSSEILYYPNNGKTLSFYAYYPYSDISDPLDIAFSINANQSSSGDFSKSDFLVSKPLNNVVKSHSSVKLDFKHLLSLVQMEVSNNLGSSGPMNVTLMQCQSKVNINLLSRTSSTNTGTQIDIEMYETIGDDGGNIYRAIVPPQTLEKGNNLFKIKQYKEVYNYTNDQDLNLTQGNVSRIVVENLPFLYDRLIVAGGIEFQMGNGSSVQTVKFENNFRMSRYMVTNAQYATFLNDYGVGDDGKSGSDTYVEASSNGVVWNGTKWTPSTDKENYPVVNVSWTGADAFAGWVDGSLPTEAQWEYVCRTNLTSDWPTYSGTALDLANYAWYSANSGGTTHAVGSLQPNNWGIYDMLGNVSEWCSDWYGSYSSGTVTDPTGPGFGSDRVVRGGSFDSSADDNRSWVRNCLSPSETSEKVGFRVVFQD